MSERAVTGSRRPAPPLILVPTDFTEVCTNAIRYGVELASLFNGSMCLLHVIAKEEEDRGSEGVEAAEQRMFECALELEHRLPGKIRVLVRKGNILKEIRKTAATVKASLLVMGTHGKQGLQHLFGSYALKVVLDAPCPVLVVQNKPFGEGFRKIVLPLTSELETRHALDWVLRVSRAGNSTIHLLQAGETDPDLRKRLDLITRKVAGVFEDHSVPCEISVLERSADFPDQVITYAGEIRSDLIMMMMMPDVEIPGFKFLAWDEQMIFNREQIPILCISPGLQ